MARRKGLNGREDTYNTKASLIIVEIRRCAVATCGHLRKVNSLRFSARVLSFSVLSKADERKKMQRLYESVQGVFWRTKTSEIA